MNQACPNPDCFRGMVAPEEAEDVEDCPDCGGEAAFTVDSSEPTTNT